VQGGRGAALLAARTEASARLAALQAHRLTREVAELLGDSKRVAADHYVYALVDYREVDRQPALGRLFA
jgi:hypothetical protein